MAPSFTESTDLSFDSTILIAVACVGMIVKLFFAQKPSTDGTMGPANAAIWGYGTMILSLLGLVIVTVALSSKNSMQNNIVQFLKSLAGGSIPVILLLVILIWLITMNILFYTRINQGKVAPEYDGMSTLSTITVFLQLMVLLNFFRDKMKADQASKSGNNMIGQIYQAFTSEMGTISYVLTTLNVILAGIMQVILTFFSTDG